MKRGVTGIVAILAAAALLLFVSVVFATGEMSGSGQSHATSTLTDSRVPGSFSVGLNYPNPFNESTNLDYSVTDESKVQVTVYNVLGHRIRSLLNQIQEPGSYRLYWDGTNARGDVVPSGLYFLVVQVEKNAAVRKMTMVK